MNIPISIIFSTTRQLLLKFILFMRILPPAIKSSLLAMFNTTGYQRLSDGPDGSKNLEIDKCQIKS